MMCEIDTHLLTLEPLRKQGAQALDVHGIEGICEIRLCEVEVLSANFYREGIVRKADDLFEWANARGGAGNPIPLWGRLIRATFAFRFADSPRPRRVEICLPNTLKLERAADVSTVEGWLAGRRFRASEA